MELVYSDKNTQSVCTSEQAALKLFGGNKKLVRALFSKIQALEAAVVLRDISQMPQFHLHPLKNKGRSKLKGYYAIDVSGRSGPWRIILQPLSNNHEALDGSNIDEIAGIVRVVKIEQVSKHYE